MNEVKREVSADAEALARHAAEFLIATATAATGEARVCLSGGSTPKRLFELLASSEFAPRVPWNRIHWYWGDERFVAPDHADSNYRMTRVAMLDKAPIPADHIHPIATVGTTPERSAADYEKLLKSRYGADTLDPARPLFDLTFLGVGDDGHTASLIPGADAALAERTRWTAVIPLGFRPEARITLTFPALDSSRHVAFLVAGAGKRDILHRIALGEDLPAARVNPVGTLHWMLDRAAAESA
jgi:6-phosphogluconolactonase